MKFIPMSLLVGGAGLVAAAPIKFVVVEHVAPVPAPPIGLGDSEAFQRAPDPAVIDLKAIQEPQQKVDIAYDIFVPPSDEQETPFAPTFISPKRHGCGKNKGKNIVMVKMDEISNFFRKIFGFDSIDLPMARKAVPPYGVHPPKMMAAHDELDEDDNKFHILPFMPGPVRGEGFPPPPGSDDPSNSGSFPPVPPPSEFRGHNRMWVHRHRHRPHSFFGRLHKALLTLSPWEGRALSFVVGCGIGVLLRMLYVFSVLAYRCFFAQPRLRLEERQEEERAPAADATTEPQASALVPPPEYDEKGDPQ